MRIVISADFSDPAGPIMAGPTEEALAATKLRVSDAASSQLAAVKMLGGKCDRALVIDHYYDSGLGGFATRRRSYRRIK